MRFEFAFDRNPEVGLRLAGITRRNSAVVVDEQWFTARFGPWTVRTPLTNVVSASVGGPYRWWTAVGVRMSVSDRGLTFGSSTRSGVCLTFREPVRGIDPWGLIRHPGLTVTVARPEDLVADLGR
ncbi:hypothetical protein ACFFQW_26980 [Umezawaea endophytica]|uniref:Uncharacterized protein n=1 Tax=Umezawaea endophytica TaxID=1654476 RepID=A0A9X3AD02_9PSEU|nr:hypothetical protein [Umezawaea endophytica]MCS7475607.1 hypothetical protein [Umezawaea endophytica]